MNKTELHESETTRYPVGFQLHFLICNSCFWCASCVYDLYKINKCPICNENTTVESIPLTNHEAYRFDYDNERGVTVEFFPIEKV